MNILERFFHIKARGSTLRQELLGGVTAFFAAAYLIAAVPALLAQTGVDSSAAMTAVCLAAALGCLLTGLLANLPFAAAPGLGFAAFFTHTLAQRYGYSWEQALALCFLSGILFLLLSLSPLRERLLDAIPMPFKFAVSAGVGLLITLSGLISAGLVTAQDNLLDMGAIISPGPLLALLGVFLTAALLLRRVPGAVLVGIAAVTALGVPLGVTLLPEQWTAAVELRPLLPDFAGALGKGALPLVSALLGLVLSQCFDGVGTLLGVAGDAKMTDSTGGLPGTGRTLAATAAATCAGALLGCSNATPLAESAVGVREGARTGLAPVVTGLLFLLALPLAPLAGAIPGAATAAALIVVGMMMMSGISQIHWVHVEVSLPCFLIIVGMPFTGSITDGIALGCISYVAVMVCRKRWAVIDPWMYALAGVFALMYLLAAL